MLKPGKRQLKDITDQELQVIVEMSHHYGCKDFWGNPVITDIDRNMFANTIVIDYEQTRIDDGEKSLTVMFFEYNSLTYHVDYRYPYARSTKSESITYLEEQCAKSKAIIEQIEQENKNLRDDLKRISEGKLITVEQIKSVYAAAGICDQMHEKTDSDNLMALWATLKQWHKELRW